MMMELLMSNPMSAIFFNLKKFIKKQHPEEIEKMLFFDDRVCNVDAARECGIPSLHFMDAKSLKKLLIILCYLKEESSPEHEAY